MEPETLESRLIKSVVRLLEVVCLDTSSAVADVDPQLRGYKSLLARLSVDQVHSMIADGRVNLYAINESEIELIVAQAVSLAARKLAGSRLVTVPKGERERHPRHLTKLARVRASYGSAELISK